VLDQFAFIERKLNMPSSVLNKQQRRDVRRAEGNATMPSPTVGDVHIPSAIGNKKKGKPQMAGKKAMDDGDEQAMGKKLGGKVPPQFLPKQKGKPAAGKDAAKGGKGKPFGKKK
jgi:hypothetical protein